MIANKLNLGNKISMIMESSILYITNLLNYDLAKEYGCTHGNIWFIMKNFTHVPDMECSKKLKEKKQNENYQNRHCKP